MSWYTRLLDAIVKGYNALVEGFHPKPPDPPPQTLGMGEPIPLKGAYKGKKRGKRGTYSQRRKRRKK